MGRAGQQLDVVSEIVAKIMAGPRISRCKKPMPFDGKRMIYGGFETLIET